MQAPHRAQYPEAPDVGAAVLLDLGGGLGALDEAAGTLTIVVLLGAEPLPPILVLLVVSVETDDVVVVSVDGAGDVAVRIDSVSVVTIAVSVADVEASEAAELATEEALAMADDAPSDAKDAAGDAFGDAVAAADAAAVTAKEAADVAPVASDDAAAVAGELAGLVRGATGIGAFEDCEPILEETDGMMLVVSDAAEPATFDSTMLSCLAADSAASEALAAEAGASDAAASVAGMTTLTGAMVTGPVGTDAVVGS